MFLYHTGDEDWQTHHVKLKAHMQHYHSLRGLFTRADQKGIGVTGGHFHTSNAKGSD